MAFGKRNIISLDIFKYNIMLLGESGCGKTTLIKEVIEKYYKNPKSGLFLEVGLERGGDAIYGINYINCPKYEMEYDEMTNSAGLWTVIEDIIENKSTEYPDLKVVVWDTLDQVIPLCESEAIRLWNKECRSNGHPERCAKTINQAWSGYGRGEKVAIDLMLNMIDSLRNVGVSTLIIGHTKTKQVEDTFSGQSYQVLTSDQQQNYFNAIKKNLHFLGLAYVDREIAKEKAGKKDFSGKDKVVGKVKSEARRIRFRDDGFVVDCKSRFANIVPEIALDADEFIDAITNAIKNEHSKGNVSLEEAIKEEKKLADAEAKRVAEAESKAKYEEELNSIKSSIVEFITENKTNMDKIKPVLIKCRELGYSNPTEITNIEDAKTVLAVTLK